jgi:DNA segregation ATPase FtsK/SpoIIIE and related proteins
MPAKKPPTKGTKGTTSKKTTKNTTSKQTAKQNPAEVPSSGRQVMDQIMPYILICVAIFVTVCFIFTGATGIIGKGLRALMYGLFSAGAVMVPLLILNAAFFWRRDSEKHTFRYRILFTVVCLIFISVLIHVFTSGGEELQAKLLWENGLEWKGGGAVGGFLGVLLLKGVGTAGALIVAFSALIIFGLYLFGLTPYSAFVFVAYHIREYRLKLAERRAEEAEFAEKQSVRQVKEPRMPVVYEPEPEQQREMPEKFEFDDDDITPPVLEDFDIDIPSEGKENKVDLTLDDIFAYTEPETLIDNSIFDFEEDKPDVMTAEADLGVKVIEVERSKIVAEPIVTKPVSDKKPQYLFPPITLLNQDTTPKNTDVSEELKTTAKRLVDTLASFKVKTKVVNYTRGPTITRYELAPEEGVRVKAISNLVDDISLNLATQGVRIEAPIPGKSAVGIEVPNRVVSTVYLRELIENQKFKAADSKINISLGADVAGDPVYADIAKMPHLLIAGATGMGKSVCINSIIVSLLYRATPEEVKLILVDPKKVELNIYNGLPHLLVPVVSDSKKAAGALNWAVTEMERRYELIESVNVRDLKSYNKIAETDPDKEVLPQIVIIIDELADLMMAAKDNVEESICRIAQKARAAGMHLIIGTQRPSVDVITGLIKANIPSRIAFTMTSLADSRTILDMSGAEKLIGRGDMLYSPVGLKPLRVQGAFVHEKEVELVTKFIKDQGLTADYDDAVINSIDKAAEEVGQSGKKGSMSASLDDGVGGDSDPMLKAAIELAVESDKISTSLIQRRLQLGYGRAAKLIDMMEERGIVSPPEGQKPRRVLITKSQWMEMVMNRDEF